MSRPTSKWLRMLPIYKHFGRGYNADFSDDAARELFEWESRGEGNLKSGVFSTGSDGKLNGYAVGKHWMDVQIAGWRKCIREGLLFKFELYEDPAYANWHWWLDRSLASCVGIRDLPKSIERLVSSV